MDPSTGPAPTVPEADWWRQAVVYQVYPRSFADADAGGLGDLRGVTTRVPYLAALGVDTVWLSPFYPSPLADGGYDIADHRDVDPRLGTLADFDELVRTLHAAGMKLIVDIVPNHSSDQHPWFQQALAAGPGSAARDRYLFRDGPAPTAPDRPRTGSPASVAAPGHASPSPRGNSASGTCTFSPRNNRTGTGRTQRSARTT